MLKLEDVGDRMNRRIALAFSMWPESPGGALRVDSSTGAGVTRIRLLMEASGRSGTTRAIPVEGRAAFVYLCFTPRGEPFAQGIGDSPERAILDAFLQYFERVVAPAARSADARS